MEFKNVFVIFFVNKTFKTVGNALKVEKEERYYIQFHFDTQFFSFWLTLTPYREFLGLVESIISHRFYSILCTELA